MMEYAAVEVGSIRANMRSSGADIVICDLGPNKGSLNHAVKASSDYLIPNHMAEQFSWQAWHDALQYEIPAILKTQKEVHERYNKYLDGEIEKLKQQIVHKGGESASVAKEDVLMKKVYERLKLKEDPPGILPNLIHNIKVMKEEAPSGVQTRRQKMLLDRMKPIACQMNFCKAMVKSVYRMMEFYSCLIFTCVEEHKTQGRKQKWRTNKNRQ